jgi:hypothetical protein
MNSASAPGSNGTVAANTGPTGTLADTLDKSSKKVRFSTIVEVVEWATGHEQDASEDYRYFVGLKSAGISCKEEERTSKVE